MKKTLSRKLLSAGILCGLFAWALPAADIVPFSAITPAQAAALIKEKGSDPRFVILDVRSAREFALNRIKGAKNVDVRAKDFKLQVEKLDNGNAYLVYCRVGLRSAKALKLMKNWDFKEAYNLAGGLEKWQAEKLPMEGKPLDAQRRKGKREGRISSKAMPGAGHRRPEKTEAGTGRL